jgi:alpha-beta hydrolase superfamily lysophospholipase
MTNNQADSNCVRASLIALDGQRILIDSWIAPEARGVVQIFHGLAEHAARYERFAQQCNQAGLHVVAHSHRGHGENYDPDNLGHFADENGWNIVINDAHMAHLDTLKNFPDLPLILFGHSLGSYIAQSYLMRHPDNVAALVLSASTYASALQLRIVRALARIESWRHGRRGQSALLNRLGFGEFNKPFEPSRTDFDWLSRDPNEVDKYVADPLCGAPSSCQLWHDLTSGFLEITSARALRNIPAELPILITGGALDPIGGDAGMTKLAEMYRGTGHEDVTLQIYPDGRHEMLNETNRDEVTDDLIRWMGSKLD